MDIITNEHLKKKINGYNLIPLEVSNLKVSNQVYLEMNTIDDFLKFSYDANFKFIYYYYTYYNSEEYTIPRDCYSEYSKEFKMVVFQHNQHIKSLDYDSPSSLTLFVLQSGTFVGVKLDNPWLDNKGIIVAEEAIEIIENKFNHEVKKNRAFQKEQQKEDENKLREIIFNDPEFKHCKNQSLRYKYLIELLEKENMMNYEYLVEPYGIPHIGKVKMFMDETWRLYKEREK